MPDSEAIAKDVVDCAIKVHKALGPGLLESAHQHCHTYELKKRGIKRFVLNLSGETPYPKRSSLL